jgi:hypothetical protein
MRRVDAGKQLSILLASIPDSEANSTIRKEGTK